MKFFEKVMWIAFVLIAGYVWYTTESLEIAGIIFESWKIAGIVFVLLIICYYLSRPKIKKPKYKREPIPGWVKQEVWKRQNYQCPICGEKSLDAIEFHHIVPASQGGSSTDPKNITGLCGNCHNMKTRYDQKTGAYSR